MFKQRRDQQAANAAVAVKKRMDGFNPDFPLARLRRVIGGEFDRQIELHSLIP